MKTSSFASRIPFAKDRVTALSGYGDKAVMTSWGNPRSLTTEEFQRPGDEMRSTRI